MKFSFSILLLVGFSTFALKAQISPRVILKTGLTTSSQYATYSNDSLNLDLDYDDLIGVPISIGFDLFSDEGLRLGIYGMYQQKGVTSEYNKTDEFNPNGGEGTEKVVSRYDYISLSVPIGYSFPLSRKFNVVATVAPRVDLDLDRESDSKFFQPYPNRNKTIFGLNGNLGFEYQIQDLVLSTQAQYQYDITPLNEFEVRDINNEFVSTLTTNNRTFSVLLGVGYML